MIQATFPHTALLIAIMILMMYITHWLTSKFYKEWITNLENAIKSKSKFYKERITNLENAIKSKDELTDSLNRTIKELSITQISLNSINKLNNSLNTLILIKLKKIEANADYPNAIRSLTKEAVKEYYVIRKKKQQSLKNNKR